MKSNPMPKPATVITGASTGLGRAITRVIAREGRIVVLVARSLDQLAEVAAEVRDAGGQAFILQMDLQDRNVAARVDTFLSQHGLFCDVLVNCAGYGLRGAASVMPVDSQLGIVDLNVRALTELTLHFLPGMAARKAGGVLNFSSVAGSVPGPYMTIYYASKAFVRSFSQALHQELRRTGVTVTCVAPGPVRTGFFASAAARQARLFSVIPNTDPQYVAERAWRGFKAGRRMVVPGIAAKLILFVTALMPTVALLPLIAWLQRSGNDPCPCGSGRKYKKCCGARR